MFTLNKGKLKMQISKKAFTRDGKEIGFCNLATISLDIEYCGVCITIIFDDHDKNGNLTPIKYSCVNTITGEDITSIINNINKSSVTEDNILNLNQFGDLIKLKDNIDMAIVNRLITSHCITSIDTET